MKIGHSVIPKRQGLYDPAFERDSCGVGFVCDIKGRRSHLIVEQGLEVLRRLAHRGATGADPKTGDGAGILIQMPHELFMKLCNRDNIALPAQGDYGSGLVFLPTDKKERQFCRDTVDGIVKKEGQSVIGWRSVAVDSSVIGKGARDTQPAIEQVFIGKGKGLKDMMDFERRLYMIRKQAENAIRSSSLKFKSFFYITNLSCRTFSYKGLLMPAQVEDFFLELKDESVKSAICLVHSRYSTNTFPTWDLSQPFRFLAHNGEINTLRGNINWMRARQTLLESKAFSREVIEKIVPVIAPGGSDSAALDNVFELLVLSGRSMPHAMMMLIPEAWEQNPLMDNKVKDFYKYHSCLIEPWDGPAAVAFTDGLRVGAVLDRNGLRPARYIVTKRDLVVMASEVGVLDISAQDILYSGRLEPGKIFFIDTQEGSIIEDAKIKRDMASRQPYRSWLKDGFLSFDSLPKTGFEKKEEKDVLAQMRAFGYTREDLKVVIKPMAETAQEPIGSMGNDTAHAVLSARPQLLYSYFKQLFAQVTNPAIDPIREELVMSLFTLLGPQGNLLDETVSIARKLHLNHPILTNDELDSLRNIKIGGLSTQVVSLLFEAQEKDGFMLALERIRKQSEDAVRKGSTFILLSDRGVSPQKAAIPALLSVGAVHHHLVRKGLRTQANIIIESAEPREVHHFALLLGYGADCINPYLAYAAVKYLIEDEGLSLDPETARKHYIKAVCKGILKILSKMGISTLQSYRGAQIFEALGLAAEVVDECFKDTVSRISGAGFKEIAQETILRHKEAYSQGADDAGLLATGGLYQWKKDGEVHLWNPESISALQDAVRKEDFARYKEFAALINDQSASPVTLRSLLKFKAGKPIPIEQVEPAEDIMRRLATGAMSFGSISKGAHETLAIAMNRIGGRSNTGEGGEDPARFHPLPNADSLRSSVKQVASGRFGVTVNYLVNADEIQIKIAQGAKPGEGGQLPGHKVSAIIARTRYTTPGVTLISPPPHHDIYSIEDLAQLIFDLKNANPRARISVKLVSEAGVGTVAAGVAKGHADMILISGGDGGTGASPASSIRHAGLPWELGISETHQTLVLNDLRSRVRLQTDGQMRTGRDIAIAALLGAEEFGFCTSALVVMGCVMLRHCNLNNCSVGIATQDKILQSRFTGRPEYVVNYFRFVAQELRQIMAELGCRSINEMVGRTDLLEPNKAIFPWKAKQLDLSGILFRPKTAPEVSRYCTVPQDHNIDKVLDEELKRICEPALKNGEPVKKEIPISNINRTTGAMLSGELCRIYAEKGLPEGTIHIKFKGVAGQSFAAFLARGITFELEGMSNDYVGKGLSGGKVVIYPYADADYKAEENIIIGNTTFYGAIDGEAYIRGVAGERFCIRNSGVYAVVEGVGDHGCEYMTGGRVVVIGRTGRNFAAGMSGGIAYVYDQEGDFRNKCNMEMVLLEGISAEDESSITQLLRNHYKYTKSPKAKMILDDPVQEIKKFVKVMPMEYKRILEAHMQKTGSGPAEDSDG